MVMSSGKRKSAIARAVLHPGKGLVKVNGTRINQFGSYSTRLKIMEPLILAKEVASKVDISVKVVGGGVTGQAEAARLAIGRALVVYDKKLKKSFEDYDRQLLVADVRRKETRKPGCNSKARSRTQKSYR